MWHVSFGEKFGNNFGAFSIFLFRFVIDYMFIMFTMLPNMYVHAITRNSVQIDMDSEHNFLVRTKKPQPLLLRLLVLIVHLQYLIPATKD